MKRRKKIFNIFHPNYLEQTYRNCIKYPKKSAAASSSFLPFLLNTNEPIHFIVQFLPRMFLFLFLQQRSWILKIIFFHTTVHICECAIVYLINNSLSSYVQFSMKHFALLLRDSRSDFKGIFPYNYIFFFNLEIFAQNITRGYEHTK